MKNIFLLIVGVICSIFLIFPPFSLLAQEDTGIPSSTQAVLHDTFPSYMLGNVLSIIEQKETEIAGFGDITQVVLVEIVSGNEKGSVQTIEYTTTKAGSAHTLLREGDPVLMMKSPNNTGALYVVIDQFRLPIVAVFALFFFALAIALGRKRGFMSLFGLGISFVVLLAYVVPRIVAGDNPFLVSAIGSVVIAVVSIVLSHGFHRRSYVALVATLLTLTVAFGLAYLSVTFAMLTGASTEEAVYLQLGYLSGLDLRGLLLGGIVIGVLGVLDDVTTAQVAAVEEIHHANPNLDFYELYKRGLSVGREHIAALINTLALAYVGASFPLFLLFSMPDNPPLWVLLNTETIVEEILRALVGGTALILAVPLSTLLAAWACEKRWLDSSVRVLHRH